jgi:hypothetical protein
MAEKVLKSLTLNFENVSSIKIPARYIEALRVDGITSTMYKAWKCDDALREHRVCSYFLVKINPRANKKEFWQQDYFREEGKAPFERIQEHKDICSVTFGYEGRFSEEIYMEWDGSPETNNRQSCGRYEGGPFFIEIGKPEESKKGNYA